jgi:hypothetical protein
MQQVMVTNDFHTNHLQIIRHAHTFKHCGGYHHNPLAWMIRHQVHLNAFALLSECGQSDCMFSHLETANFICEHCDVGTSHFPLRGF